MVMWDQKILNQDINYFSGTISRTLKPLLPTLLDFPPLNQKLLPSDRKKKEFRRLSGIFRMGLNRSTSPGQNFGTFLMLSHRR
ncbi:MAG: hypothetical protein CM15mP45_16490 [Deltaproteobacteria bacterium]|nr:MAG: hypothetical protein CM15mP45_16490 [Deltaproteobacteria bacterium]